MSKLKSYIYDWLEDCGYSLGYDVPSRLPEIKDMDFISKHNISYNNYKGEE